MRNLIDAGVAGVLVLALLLVVLIDRLMTSPPSAPGQPMATGIPVVSKKLRMAVTESFRDKDGQVWDDMPKLLATLGDGYPFKEIHDLELENPQRLADFDVLFLTCAARNFNPTLTANLRNFVSQGGTIYASDWRYDCIAAAFPEVASAQLKGEGRGQELDARVVDPGLSDLVGPTVPLRFDLDRWKTAAFAGDKVKVLLEGTYQRQVGIAVAPLLVKFQFEKGTVIFTSFHNEKQNSAIEQKLLKYLVFSAVTAQLENQVNQSLIKGGFSPQKQNLLSASADNPKVSYKYQSTKAGKIRFVLAFDERGAKLRLSVVSPTGKKTENEGTSSFVIEEASAGKGEWQYTVTALTVPFPEFPFTMTVAESD